MSISGCKKAFKQYVVWVNQSKHKLDCEKRKHLKCLIEMWNVVKNDAIEENGLLHFLMDMKDHHSYLNGQSGNDDLWMTYIKTALRYRVELMSKLH